MSANLKNEDVRLLDVSVRLDKDVITFAWRQEGGARLFRRTEFYICYPGLSIEGISRDLAWSMFSCLVISLYARLSRSVHVVFPEPVADVAVETWLSYHDCANVTAENVVRKGLPAHPGTPDSGKVGVLFGGGKDSLFAVGVLSELYGASNVTLISCVFPVQRAEMKRVEERRDRLALLPLQQKTGVNVQKIVTDFRGNLADGFVTKHLHSALYHGLYMPLVPVLGLELVTHSNEFNHYWTSQVSGQRTFGFRRSRPEYDDFVADRISRVGGHPYRAKNLNYCIAKEGGIAILIDRYPELLENIMMCESKTDPNVRWCSKCYKCFQYAVYAVYFDLETKDIDLDWFFSRSPFVLSMLEMIAEHPEYIERPRWIPALSRKTSYTSFCHLAATMDERRVDARLGETAAGNFRKIMRCFPKVDNPLLMSYMSAALDQLAPPRREGYEEILASVLYRETGSRLKVPWAAQQTIIDYGERAEVPARQVTSADGSGDGQG